MTNLADGPTPGTASLVPLVSCRYHEENDGLRLRLGNDEGLRILLA